MKESYLLILNWTSCSNDWNSISRKRIYDFWNLTLSNSIIRYL